MFIRLLRKNIPMLNEWYEAENNVEKSILSEDKLQEMEEAIQKVIQFCSWYVFRIMRTDAYLELKEYGRGNSK